MDFEFSERYEQVLLIEGRVPGVTISTTSLLQSQNRTASIPGFRNGATSFSAARFALSLDRSLSISAVVNATSLDIQSQNVVVAASPV